MKMCGTNDETTGIFQQSHRKNHRGILCNSTSNFDGDVTSQKAPHRALS